MSRASAIEPRAHSRIANMLQLLKKMVRCVVSVVCPSLPSVCVFPFGAHLPASMLTCLASWKLGVCYLYMKEVERSHTPSKLWDMIKLSPNYKDALAQIDQHLMYWPKHLIHRNKQRLTKIWQYLIRMRRLRSKVRTTVSTINQKVERREKVRESKALKAASIENQIKSELLDRLKQGTYGGIYNFDSQSFREVLDEEGIEDEAMFLPNGEEEVDDEFVEDYNDDFDDLEESDVSDGEGGSEDASDDDSDEIPSTKSAKKRSAPSPTADEKKRPSKSAFSHRQRY
jgi:protein MAK16